MTLDVEAAIEREDVYSRLTLIGSRTRVDMVLPSQQSIGSLLPDIVRVLGERPGVHRVSLVTSTGAVLGSDTTLASAGVVDGTVLRLLVEDLVPPPPVVNDITEETASDLDARSGRLTAAGRMVLSTVLAGLAGALVPFQISLGGNPSHDRGAIFAAATALLIATGIAAALRRKWAAIMVLMPAATLLAGGLLLTSGAHRWAIADRVAVVLAIGWAGALGVAALARRTGVMAGSAVALILTGSWLALRLTPLGPVETDALIAVLAVLGCGVLPRWALTLSGLASLDDQRLTGVVVRRSRLRRSLAEAHASVITAVLAFALSAGATGTLLAEAARPWSLGLAVAIGVVLAMRARAFPLAVEVAALSAAAAAVVGGLLTAWVRHASRTGLPVAVTVIAVVATVIALTWEPSAHTRVRLRRAGDRLEALGVVALVPSLVGVFGVFGRLLHTF